MRIKLEYWHQFDCRYSKFLQIRNLFDQSGKSAAPFLGDAGTRVAGKTADMHFVYDGLGRRSLERCVSFPIVSTRIGHNALNRRFCVVAFDSSCVATVILWNNRATSIRIDEDFGGIKAHSIRWIEGAPNSISVDLSCFHTRYENVPIVICPVGCGIDRDHTLGPIVITVKEEEFDPGCAL